MDFVDGPQGSDLAGPDNWRKTIYGSPRVVALGGTALPLLASQDLYLETPDELAAAAHDCGLILANLIEVSTNADARPDHVAHRVGNVQDAISRAREIDAYVVVW
jgi:sugar phosphate isomerase/epimerase